MKLIGMLDSPYVRRVAISLQLLGLRFDHEALSVFRTFDAFSRINPVVKAPTLVCDDGTVLMESTLILEYAEALAHPRSLMPAALPDRLRALRVTGLGLAAMEKSVQLYYERELRPPEKRHAPWLDRVIAQLRAACDELERAVAAHPIEPTREAIGQAGVTLAVAWRFMQEVVPGVIPPATCPRVAEFSELAEALPEFIAAPHGLGRVAVS